MQDINNDGDEDDDRQHRLRFEAQLEGLRSNSRTTFDFSFVWGFGQGRWSLLQASELLSALKVNTSVVNLVIELLQDCPLTAIPLLLQYIESNSRLKKVTIGAYNFCLADNEETREKYRSQIGRFFKAVLKQPSIKSLVVRESGNSPRAMFDLLSESKALTCFEIDDLPSMSPVATAEMARAVAGGFARNTSLKEIKLRIDIAYLGIAMSGIGRSAAVESLTVYLRGSTVKCYAAISNMLPISPSVKILTVSGVGHFGAYDDEDGIDQLFCALREPGCAGLEKLVFLKVRFGERPHVKSYPTAPPLPQESNNSLQVLDLHKITLYNNRSVSQLWHLVGLKELHVTKPVLESDDDPDCWTELVRRNPNLLKLSIKDSSWMHCAKGLLNGACGHELLKSLVLDLNRMVYLDEHVGAQICRLLKETKALKTVHMSGFNFYQRQCAELIAEGICENKTLQCLVFDNSDIPLPVFTVLVESFVVNQTMTTFRIDNCIIEGSDSEKQAFCQTLSHAFRMNTSLESFRLPHMNINTENGLMNVLVGGLSGNNTIKTIDFTTCTCDNAALTCLQQALMVTTGSDALSISSIILPHLTDEEAIKPFLRNLGSMPLIKEVVIQNSLDAEGKNLLFQAVKENKTLFSVEWLPNDAKNDPVDIQIDFYLGLNRLGRQIVETPNVPTSCWPILLSRMTCQPNKDVASLFYFVRKFFANHRDPQQQQQPHTEQDMPNKRARLE